MYIVKIYICKLTFQISDFWRFFSNSYTYYYLTNYVLFWSIDMLRMTKSGIDWSSVKDRNRYCIFINKFVSVYVYRKIQFIFSWNWNWHCAPHLNFPCSKISHWIELQLLWLITLLKRCVYMVQAERPDHTAFIPIYVYVCLTPFCNQLYIYTVCSIHQPFKTQVNYLIPFHELFQHQV